MKAHKNALVDAHTVIVFTPRLTEEQRAQALHWYAVDGFDLQTIGQHFGLTENEVGRELNTVKRRSRPLPVGPHDRSWCG